MTASQKRVQRGVKPGGVSLVSISASPGVEGVVGCDPVINDDFTRRRADSLDAEAAYYRHRAIQREQALGAGYYVDLLREMGYRPGRDGPADTDPKRSDVMSSPGDPARRPGQRRAHS